MLERILEKEFFTKAQAVKTIKELIPIFEHEDKD